MKRGKPASMESPEDSDFMQDSKPGTLATASIQSFRIVITLSKRSASRVPGQHVQTKVSKLSWWGRPNSSAVLTTPIGLSINEDCLPSRR